MHPEFLSFIPACPVRLALRQHTKNCSIELYACANNVCRTVLAMINRLVIATETFVSQYEVTGSLLVTLGWPNEIFEEEEGTETSRADTKEDKTITTSNCMQLPLVVSG